MGRSLTKDELFLVKLCTLAKGRGDPFAEVDSYEVGKAMGQNPKSVDNIVRMLAQANFVKKGEESWIYLTEAGYSLVQELA